jgi:hypothetical protein
MGRRAVAGAGAGAGAPRAGTPPAAPRVFLPVAGPVHRGTLRVEGRSLPLPPGDWVEIIRRERRGGEVGGPREAEVGLVRASAAGVDAFIAVRTADHPGGGTRPVLWGSSAVCTRTDALARVVAVHTDTANECAALSYAVATPGQSASGTWSAFLSLYEGRDGYMPGTMISVSYRFAGPRRATSIGYYFGVEAYGFPRGGGAGRAESPWQRGSLNEERRAHLHRLHAWMRASFEPVKGGRRAATRPRRRWRIPDVAGAGGKRAAARGAIPASAAALRPPQRSAAHVRQAPHRPPGADEHRRPRLEDHGRGGAAGRHHAEPRREGALGPLPEPARRRRHDARRAGRLMPVS